MADSRERTSGRRWVKVVVLTAVVIGLLVIAVMLLTGGGHRPRPHAPFGAISAATAR